MPFDYITLKLLWYCIIGLLVAGFALTEGFGLGIGMLLPFAGRDDEQRRLILNSYGPVAEGNQTWLIAAAGSVFAVWPLVYAVALSCLYALLMPALFALLLRPVALHYRSKRSSPGWRAGWDRCLFGASLLATLALGAAVGNLAQGLPFRFDGAMRMAHGGSLADLLNPSAVLGAALAAALLALHGAAWLQFKTQGEMARRARAWIMAAALLAALLMAAAASWIACGIDGYRVIVMPDASLAFRPPLKMVEHAAGAWLDNYRHWPLMLLLPAGAGASLALAAWSGANRRALPALLASGSAIVLVLASTGAMLFPFLLPSSIAPNDSLTIWDAAASYNSLAVMFWSALVLLPLVTAYSAWVYRIMRGKVTAAWLREQQHSAY
jgi:cytochrome d ubiquinol oxidase subunit II